jgi:hypothetical protein
MVLLATTLVLALAAAPDPRPWMNKADPPGARAKKIVAQMTQARQTSRWPRSWANFSLL